jgi:hypothetical protein
MSAVSKIFFEIPTFTDLALYILSGLVTVTVTRLPASATNA